MTRREFLKLSGYGLLTLLESSLSSPEPRKPFTWDTAGVTPERNQAVISVMLEIGHDSKCVSRLRRQLPQFEDAIGRRCHVISTFNDLDTKPPKPNVIEHILASGRGYMSNLQARPTNDPKDRKGRFRAREFLAGRHDVMLTHIAGTIRRFRPVQVPIRFQFEINGYWVNGHRYPGEYREIWKYVRKKFNEMGADNARFIFSPYTYPINYELYYPGDGYVDAVGVSVYNQHTNDPEALMDAPHYYLRRLAPRVPLVFGELGIAGRKRDALLARLVYTGLRQGIRMVNYFQIQKSGEETWKLTDPEEIPLTKKVLQSGAFLPDSAPLEQITANIFRPGSPAFDPA